MLKRLHSSWLWVMTAVRLLADLSGVRVLLSGQRFATRIVLIAFIVTLPIAGAPQNASPIGILLIGAIILLAVHSILKVTGKGPDAPELPDISGEVRESVDDFHRAHRDLAELGRSNRNDDNAGR
ncbi:MAG: hypothetical protein ACREMA_15465 [Longimicrobiales bacterium]